MLQVFQMIYQVHLAVEADQCTYALQGKYPSFDQEPFYFILIFSHCLNIFEFLQEV